MSLLRQVLSRSRAVSDFAFSFDFSRTWSLVAVFEKFIRFFPGRVRCLFGRAQCLFGRVQCLFAIRTLFVCGCRWCRGCYLVQRLGLCVAVFWTGCVCLSVSNALVCLFSSVLSVSTSDCLCVLRTNARHLQFACSADAGGVSVVDDRTAGRG